jgi:aminoglycoside phosphotransferase (APT) family kinase protein
LKISDPAEPVERWRTKLEIQQLASDAQVAPRIVHADESRRAVVSDFIVDRSFQALYWNPTSRESALTMLGRTIRRVHEMPLPAAATGRNAREFLASVWTEIDGNAAVPTFVVEAVQRELSAAPINSERPVVLSHNDVNPTNLVYDGERLLLLDWEVAGPNDPFYDLAAASVFLRMDEPTCRQLLAAHDDAPVPTLPAGFIAYRRLVAVLCGTMFLKLAHKAGHTGAGDETLESTMSLGDFYQRLRTGAVSVASGEGQWSFGLALVKQSLV